MEVVTILIGVAVFVISALLIYCISAFSMREKTFEEVIEEQRRREEEEREKIKAEKKVERELHKKKYKKGKDKVKEKAAQVIEPELKEIERPMVNLELEPEIIEPTETLGLGTGLRQRGTKKEKAAKPILLNKGEHTPVVEKAPELFHKPVVPKDELELKKSHEKVVVEKVEKVEKVKVIHSESHSEKEIKIKHSAESKENLPPKKVEKDEHITKQYVSDVDKRPVKAKVAAEDSAVNGARLISLVKSANLSDSEVQSLIDTLLNKQGSAATESWNKKSQKGDPVAALKKQLEEKERALQEEQALTVATNSRVKELRNELVAEKTKLASLEKKFQEKIEQHQAELIALQQRMQHTHDQHLIETSNLQARIRALDQGGDRAAIQKLSDENKILQDSLNLKVAENVKLNEKLKSLEKDLATSVKNIHAVESTKKALESRIGAHEDTIRKLESAQKDVDSMTNRRIEEVNQELRKAEAKNTSLSSDLQKANSALNTAQGEVKTLKTKLQELETHLTRADLSKEIEARLQDSEQKRSDLEGNLKNVEKQLAGLSQRVNEYETQINRLQQENRALLDENKTISERLQAAPASNGDIHENGPSVTLAEHERIVSGKDKELNELTASLESQKKSVFNIQGQLDSKLAEVSELQEQLNQQKKKNNELREKNWKAMEALEKSEKSASEKVDKALKSARDLSTAGIAEIESYDKIVFQRLFPDVQVSDKLAHKEWVVAFEKLALKKVADKSESSAKTSVLAEENQQLKKELESIKNNAINENRLIELEEQNKKIYKQLEDYEKRVVELKSQNEKLKQIEAENYQLKSRLTSSENDADRYTELENDNRRLTSELESYRHIVSETENKLHQLEKSIDQEAKTWQEKLKQAQSQPREDTGLLQRIRELESVISQQERQLQEYRNVLSSTGNRLRELEGKVRTEEKSWEEKLITAHSELTQTKNNVSNLTQEIQVSKGSHEDLSDIGFAYHCVEKSLTTIVDEMEARVIELEDELREAHEMIIVITKEKESVITQLTEIRTQTAGVNTNSIEKEVAEIRLQLEAERKKNKELSLNIVKLNGIIKTGQDALSQEQSLVKKLQESLDYKSVSSGATELDEVDQLRIKLSEKQKLLEREISTNKQLSERLAQLGMLAASTSDSGTSV